MSIVLYSSFYLPPEVTICVSCDVHPQIKWFMVLVFLDLVLMVGFKIDLCDPMQHLNVGFYNFVLHDLGLARVKIQAEVQSPHQKHWHMLHETRFCVCVQTNQSVCVCVCAHTPAHGSTWAENIPCIRMLCFPVWEAPGAWAVDSSKKSFHEATVK
jgi:hypothetical protein